MDDEVHDEVHDGANDRAHDDAHDSRTAVPSLKNSRRQTRGGRQPARDRRSPIDGERGTVHILRRRCGRVTARTSNSAGKGRRMTCTEKYHLGPGPAEEECAQVGSDGYEGRATAECRAYIPAIKMVCGDPPANARLRVEWADHDFGRYAVTLRSSFQLPTTPRRTRRSFEVVSRPSDSPQPFHRSGLRARTTGWNENWPPPSSRTGG